jgi:FAD/FMN-containing dehydrogenase
MGTVTTLERVEELQAQLRGGLITREDAGYDAARAVYNAMIDKRPALIARCRDVGDVRAALSYARQNGLDVAVRGGGHNGAGLGTVDDGLVIDLSPMNYVRVDPASRTAEVGGGSTMGDVDHATHAFGLATPFGIISTTGVGLLLGGGVGHLTRKYGLSIDNILAADVVLADGTFVRASEDENADLFWAIRGGGGNFGVVTALTLQLHPVSTVIAGPILYPIDAAAEVLAWYREFLPAQPEELTGFFAFLTVPPGPPFPEPLHMQKVCAVAWCYGGDDTAAVDELLKPARELFTPLLDGVMPLPLPAWNGAFDGLYPAGDQWYWRGDYVKEIPDAAIDIHAAFGKKLPTWKSTMHLYPSDGAPSRVAPDATPWAYRDAKWTSVFAGVDPDPANAEAIKAWTIEYQEALHPYSMGGSYMNFMMEEGQERVQAAYGPNYARLAAIKAKYDPENVFHVNQNIKPAA